MEYEAKIKVPIVEFVELLNKCNITKTFIRGLNYKHKNQSSNE